jgi:putative endonuclease
MNYFVYIVRCGDNSLYTGITTDLDRRIQEHNGELPGGAKYTAARKPVSLVYRSDFSDRSTASKEEARIKKMTKVHKELLVNK